MTLYNRIFGNTIAFKVFCIYVFYVTIFYRYVRGAFTQAARIHSYRRTGYIKISTKGEDVMATGVYTAYKKDGTEYGRTAVMNTVWVINRI